MLELTTFVSQPGVTDGSVVLLCLDVGVFCVYLSCEFSLLVIGGQVKG